MANLSKSRIGTSFIMRRVLHNLETLDLRESGVRRMPREIYKLKKLRHLLVYDKLFGFLGGLQMDGGP